uniref:E3 ubiquitin-protein ligase RNF144A-like n=1 Tax=Myxine glutinosa TaxID=7769 RepID=UPI0035901D20
MVQQNDANSLTIFCKLCLSHFSEEQATVLEQCGCVFCTGCVKVYLEMELLQGASGTITCPDYTCPKKGHVQDHEIERLASADVLQHNKQLQFEREVHQDPERTWCPVPTCQLVCPVPKEGSSKPLRVTCPACQHHFCSHCRSEWDIRHSCSLNGIVLWDDEDDSIKRCPACKILIERNDGCAQMMCSRCRHAFCWYCLQSLDDDFLLRHYDQGPCRNKLGHTRASVLWHRTQVICIFAGLGVLLLAASPLLLVAAPCVLCAHCKPKCLRKQTNSAAS